MEPSAVARRSGSFEAHIAELPSFAASWLLGLGAASWTDVRYLWSSEDALFEEFIAETQHDHESLEALLNLWRRAVRLSESIVEASSAELVLETEHLSLCGLSAGFASFGESSAENASSTDSTMATKCGACSYAGFFCFSFTASGG